MLIVYCVRVTDLDINHTLKRNTLLFWVEEFDREMRSLFGAFEHYFSPGGWKIEQPKCQGWGGEGGGHVEVLI